MKNRGTKVSMLIGLIAACFIISGIGSAVQAQNSVTLAWDPSPDPALAGYRLYEGLVSHVYTSSINVGKATTGTATGLGSGLTYFFAITAYDTNGLESSYSSEISYTVPISVTPPARLQMLVNSSRQVTLSGTAPALYTYAVLSTRDFKTWTTNGSVTVSATGTFQFTDPAKATNATCGYRLRQTSP